VNKISLLLGVLFIMACTQERYVLLPDESGQSGSLLVEPRAKAPLTLDTPYAMSTSGVWGIGKRSAEPAEVDDVWRGAMRFSPLPARKFTLYFVEGSDELTADSKRELQGVFDEIRRRKVADIVVIGHTDTVGSPQFNDRLAESRAMAMRSELERLGIDPEAITVSSRGERELMVTTPDEVAEPLNRRVEIQVR